MQALAFLGYLLEWNVHYRLTGGGHPAFAVSKGEAVCWFDRDNWYVSGDAGSKLGQALWQRFLDLGGPRPTEFHFRASTLLLCQSNGNPAFVRQGRRFLHYWELPQSRMRPTEIG
jgi:hypothetical protein